MTAVDQKTAPSQHTTALDEHRERNADLATLDALEKSIAHAGVEFIYYQTSHPHRADGLESRPRPTIFAATP